MYIIIFFANNFYHNIYLLYNIINTKATIYCTVKYFDTILLSSLFIIILFKIIIDVKIFCNFFLLLCTSCVCECCARTYIHTPGTHDFFCMRFKVVFKQISIAFAFHFVSYSIQALYTQRGRLPSSTLSLRGLTYADDASFRF